MKSQDGLMGFGHPLQFLTNVFFIPYMALRNFDDGKPNKAPDGCVPSALPSYAAVLGVVSALVGLVTCFWVPLAHPEFGGLSDRSAALCRCHTLTSHAADTAL